MQQHLIANAYPGLFDGIMPARSYPDVMTFLQPLYDCEMIRNVVDKSTNNWTYEQKGAVAGKYWGYCVSNGTRYPNARLDWCDAAVKDYVSNDPVLKQKGIRCTFQDNLVNIFGADPATGFARQPFDNVGVQYGLNALNEGKISFAQFIELNSKIGGFDMSGKIVADRMKADPVALRRPVAGHPRRVVVARFRPRPPTVVGVVHVELVDGGAEFGLHLVAATGGRVVERAVAAAKQEHEAAFVQLHRDVGVPVAVEVAARDRGWSGADGVMDRRREGSVGDAVTQRGLQELAGSVARQRFVHQHHVVRHLERRDLEIGRAHV